LSCQSPASANSGDILETLQSYKLLSSPLTAVV
jgi:hypothetical protein